MYSKCFVPSEAQASEGGMDLVKAKAADIFPQPRVMSPANCRASEGESFRGKSLYSCTWGTLRARRKQGALILQRLQCTDASTLIRAKVMYRRDVPGRWAVASRATFEPDEDTDCDRKGGPLLILQHVTFGSATQLKLGIPFLFSGQIAVTSPNNCFHGDK